MSAVDYFLKIDGIEGELHDAKHKHEIDIISWNWGEKQSGTFSDGGGGGAGTVDMQDFNFSMQVNKATPKLMLACATGDHIPKAVLTCRKAGGNQQPYLIVTLTDLLISSYQTGGSGSEVIPHDKISLNFSKVEFEYRTQDAKGTIGSPIKAGYDLRTNKKV